MFNNQQIRIRGLSILSVVLALLGILISPIASAQDNDGANVAISPRAYFTFIDTSDYSEVAEVLMGGLSVTFGPAGGNWDLTLNALIGSGDSDWTALSENPFTGWGQTGQFDIDRADYEVLWRYRLKDSPIYIGLGARFVDIEEQYIGDIDGLVEVDTTEVWLGEFAIGFSAQASEGSRHSMFGNLLVGIGQFDGLAAEVSVADIEDDGSALLFDANIGYQFVINQTTSLSTRYRVIALQSSGEEDALDVVHGPELAFTFRF
jgi:hypothetical protein